MVTIFIILYVMVICLLHFENEIKTIYFLDPFPCFGLARGRV